MKKDFAQTMSNFWDVQPLRSAQISTHLRVPRFWGVLYLAEFIVLYYFLDFFLYFLKYDTPYKHC
jgi:hypothetical protein